MSDPSHQPPDLPARPDTPAERARMVRARGRQDEMLGAVDVGLWYCDLPFDELMWDRQVKEHFWLPPEARVTIDTFYERMHPDDRERTRLAIGRSITEHVPYDIEYRTVAPEEQRLGAPVAPPGTVRWVRAIGYTGYDAAGQPDRFDGITVDVTATKRAEARLATSEARFQALVDATDQYVWTNDAQGRMTGEQPGWARLTGQTPAEYAGFGWADAVHPDDRALTLAGWERAVAACGRFEVEHRVRRSDGVWRRFWVRAIPIRGADGQVREWVGLHTDVTEQARAREEIERKATELETLSAALAHSNRELDQFAYVASHDLKAPLRGIANLAQWITEDLGDQVTGDTRDHLRLLVARVHQMDALITGILTYARAGRGQIVLEPVDLDALVRTVAELVSPPAGTRIEIAEGLPTVVGERVPLQQVLINLVGNAVKFTTAARPDAVVRIGWRDAGAWVELTVADNGPGIAPEYHERIWGIFQTLQGRDQVEGTGIGLAVVKKLVEARGGRVWVTSASGEGSTFHLTIPKVTSASLAAAPDGAGPVDASPSVAAAAAS